MTASRPVGPRLFTVDEASSLIPFLEKALSEMAAFRTDLRALRKDIEVLSLIAASAGATENPDTTELRQKRRRYRTAAAELEKINTALEDAGCLVKHPDEGLVDFFSLLNGRIVFLCWKVGEKAVAYWHPLSGGYAGRRPLPGGSPSESSS